jgi:hypothetical protein
MILLLDTRPREGFRRRDLFDGRHADSVCPTALYADRGRALSPRRRGRFTA